jgi:membrane-bound metal-dependent hydrolase YbcI (DUF457 family)
MPFTPFHLGPSSWIGLILFKFLDFPSFLLASVIVDVEPFAVIFFGLRYPLHGFFHTFVGGSIIAMLAALTMYYLRNNVRKFTNVFHLEQDSSFKKILWTSFLGVYFHILLDAPLYTDIQPFYPIANNPLFGLFSSSQIYFFCSISFLIAIVLYFVRLLTIRRRT